MSVIQFCVAGLAFGSFTLSLVVCGIANKYRRQRDAPAHYLERAGYYVSNNFDYVSLTHLPEKEQAEPPEGVGNR